MADIPGQGRAALRAHHRTTMEGERDMFRIDTPHPLGMRKFTTAEQAARTARAFGLDPRKIVVAPARSPKPVPATEGN